VMSILGEPSIRMAMGDKTLKGKAIRGTWGSSPTVRRPGTHGVCVEEAVISGWRAGPGLWAYVWDRTPPDVPTRTLSGSPCDASLVPPIEKAERYAQCKGQKLKGISSFITVHVFKGEFGGKRQ
jgi:hypothetical protein